METSRVNLIDKNINLVDPDGYRVASIDIPSEDLAYDWKPSLDETKPVKITDLQVGEIAVVIGSPRSNRRFGLILDLEKLEDIIKITFLYADGTFDTHSYALSWSFAVLTHVDVVLAFNAEEIVAKFLGVKLDFKGLADAFMGRTEIRSDEEQIPTDENQTFSDVEIPAENDMTDAEREHYAPVGPKTKKAMALKVLDIIELFGKNYVVMYVDSLTVVNGMSTHAYVELLDLETRKIGANFSVPRNSDITVIGSLV